MLPVKLTHVTKLPLTQMKQLKALWASQMKNDNVSRCISPDGRVDRLAVGNAAIKILSSCYYLQRNGIYKNPMLAQ
jgi:hypothetical protein